MILRKIKISELTALTQSAEYASWKHIPISPSRAYSQSLNPYAHSEDIALVIALDDKSNELLAYAGAYPSKMENNSSIRYAWNTCWWAGEGLGGDIAMNVFISFLQTWEKKVAFSDMTEKTYKIIRSLGFCVAMQRDGIVLNIRPGITSRMRSVSYSKRKIRFVTRFALLTGLPWIADQLFDMIWALAMRFRPSIKQSEKPLKIDFPESKDYAFIQIQGTSNFHNPCSEELKLPPWLVKPSRENEFLRKKYYFSSFACRFSIFWLRWETEGKINALVNISLKDGVLKTLYTYCDKDYINQYSKSLMDYCLSTPEIRTLITSELHLVKYISQRKFFIMSRKHFTRYTAISKDLIKHLDKDPVLQDGDGDYKFT